MNTERKWMVTLDNSTYEWVKRNADELQIHGSDIIKELILRAMEEDKSHAFRDSLLETRAKLRRRELEAKRAAIEAELKSLGPTDVGGYQRGGTNAYPSGEKVAKKEKSETRK